MFRDLNQYRSHREFPPQPNYKPPTRKQEMMIVWVIGFNLIMVLLGPFCGSSVVEVAVSVFQAF
jgi:hypothetical protein